MGVPIPRPRHVVAVVRQGFQALEWMIMLVPRIVALVNEIEMMATRVGTVLSNIEETQRRVSQTVTATDVIVADAALVTARVTPLLDAYQPALERLQPIVVRMAETTSPDEIDAIVTLLDTLPEIVRKLDSDILPILDTLGTVAPDLRDLLDVSKQLNEMLGAVPGLGRIKQRVEEQQAHEDDYRADEEPPSRPSRAE
jgi:hypothetical protein